jgi:hypothetical protein
LGRTLLAIENYRTGSTWKRMKTSPIIQRGLAQAGFFAKYPYSVVPAPWAYGDVGVPDGNAAGFSYYSNGVFQVSGGGAINAGTNDAIQYCYRPIKGDCIIQALITGIGDTNASSAVRAGVMIRETLDPGSTHASMLFRPTTNGAAFYYRTNTGAANGNSLMAGQLPYWVRVVRSANSFSGYVSPDGTNWTRVGAVKSINMATNVYVGLAASSSQFGVPCQTYYTNVTFSGLSPTIVISKINFSGTNLVCGGVSGYANGAYYVLGTTNLALPLAQWQRINTNYFDSAGNFTFSNLISFGVDHKFYRLQIP